MTGKGCYVKVLVATDDRALRGHADRVLQTAGYEVLLARDGVEALARTKAESPSMVLLDWALAGIDGIRVCQRIRQLAGGEDPYLTVMLGASQIDRTGDVLAAGADDWLARHCEPAEVLARLQVARHVLRQRAFSGALAQLSDIARFRADIAGAVFEVSAACAAVTGSSPAQSLGRGWLQAAVADERSALAAAWDAAVSAQCGCEYTYAIDDAVRGRVTVLLRARPVQVDGAVTGFIGIFEDRTREATLAHAVKRSEERFATLADALPQTIAYVDANQTIRSRNRTPGMLAPPVTGMTLHHWLGEDTYQRVARQVGIALRGHRVRFECPPSDQTGDHQVHYDLVPDRTTGNTIDGFVAIVTDTTEQHRIAKRLQVQENTLSLRHHMADQLQVQIGYFDHDLRLAYFNAAFESAWRDKLGTAPVVGVCLQDLLEPPAFGEIERQIERALAGVPVQFEWVRMHAGQQQISQMRCIPECASNGKVVGLLMVATDVTEQHALRESGARQAGLLQGLMQNLQQPCVLIDLAEHIRFHNEAYRVRMSETDGSLDGAHAALVLGRDHYLQHQEPFLAALAGVPQQSALMLKRCGVLYDCRVSYTPHRNAQGDVAGVWCIVTSMVEQQELSTVPELPPQHDATTGLLTRLACEATLQQAIARANRSNMLMALVFVELDGFAQLVAALGPKAADKMLAAVGRRLRGCVTETDVVARWGDVQFIAILECVELTADADAVAAGMLDKLQISYRSGISRHLLTASIGVAILRAGETSGNDLMQRADHALYAAKSSGRNRVRRSA